MCDVVSCTSCVFIQKRSKDTREKNRDKKGGVLRQGHPSFPSFRQTAKWGTTRTFASLPATSSGVSSTTQRHRGHHICKDPCSTFFFLGGIQALAKPFQPPPLLHPTSFSPQRKSPGRRAVKTRGSELSVPSSRPFFSPARHNLPAPLQPPRDDRRRDSQRNDNDQPTLDADITPAPPSRRTHLLRSTAGVDITPVGQSLHIPRAYRCGNGGTRGHLSAEWQQIAAPDEPPSFSSQYLPCLLLLDGYRHAPKAVLFFVLCWVRASWSLRLDSRRVRSADAPVEPLRRCERGKVRTRPERGHPPRQEKKTSSIAHRACPTPPIPVSCPGRVGNLAMTRDDLKRCRTAVTDQRSRSSFQNTKASWSLQNKVSGSSRLPGDRSALAGRDQSRRCGERAQGDALDHLSSLYLCNGKRHRYLALSAIDNICSRQSHPCPLPVVFLACVNINSFTSHELIPCQHSTAYTNHPVNIYTISHHVHY